MGGPEMAPHTPQRSSRPGEAVARLDPQRSSRPGEAVARLDLQRSSRPGEAVARLDLQRSSRPGEAVARLDPQRSSRPGEAVARLDPNRSSRPGEAVARLDPRTLVAPRRSRGAPRPQPLVAPRRSRGAPRYSDRLLIRLFRVTLGGARRVGYHRRIIQTEFLHETVRRIWGYDRFLPLQQEAIDGVLAGRDSLVVLPTGGGKSLCYQAPAAHLRRLAVVVSPLIALMKDQVDGLRQAGVPAAMINSSQNGAERAAVMRAVDGGGVQLLYVAPERLVMDGFLERLRRAQPAFVAVDEAHCISQWGHDFRPEYRQLRVMREALGALAVHAYTATATPPVRDDIVAELRLRNPLVLVGSFDHRNLVYRVRPRTDRLAQVVAAINRHRDQAG